LVQLRGPVYEQLQVAQPSAEFRPTNASSDGEEDGEREEDSEHKQEHER
jgi:hypothetical protein